MGIDTTTEFEGLAFLGAFVWPILILGIWSLVWKGLALWRAAQLKSTGWFVALLILNTVGILEIIYLLATNKQFKNVVAKE